MTDRIKLPLADPDVNVLSLVKGCECYVFAYHDDQKPLVNKTIGRFASDPELSFSWYDAAVLHNKLKDQ